MRLNKELTKKFNKISNVIKLDKFLHNEVYYFDNGQVEKIVDINKDNVDYSIIKLNTVLGTRDYLVYAIIKTNDKQATHQLLKSFNNNKTKSNEYFRTLCSYIKNNSNDDIINKCFEELSDFPRKNFFTKLLGI